MDEPALSDLNHGPGLTRVRFVPGGTKLISIGRSGGVRIWETEMGSSVAEPVGRIQHEGPIMDARITRDGSRLAVAGGSATLANPFFPGAAGFPA